MFMMKHIPTGLTLPYKVYSSEDAQRTLRKLNRQLSRARRTYNKYHLPKFTLQSIAQYASDILTASSDTAFGDSYLPLDYILCPPSRKVSSTTFLTEAALFRTWVAYLRRCKVIESSCRPSNIGIIEALVIAELCEVFAQTKLSLAYSEFVLLPYETY